MLSGTTIGSFTNSGGTLAITFNGNATQARVNEVLSSITYANASDAPPASVLLTWTFSDGNAGAQGTGGALSASGATVVNITAANDPPQGSVTISGTSAQGKILTAGNTITDADGIPTTGPGAIGYQWEADGIEIGGATGATLTLTQAQVGKAISVVARYTDNGGTQESVASGDTGRVQADDTTPPTVTTFSPTDEATGVVVGANIVLTFSEPIQRGTGQIVLKTASGETVEIYDADTSANLNISGNTLIINPSADFSFMTGYSLVLDGETIKDLAGNNYAGSSIYNFSTQVDPNTPVLTASDITDPANQFFFEGHIYEFVSTPTGISWIEALNQSSLRSIHGVRGHLVTLTSIEEDLAVFAEFSDRVSENQYIALGASDEANEGIWRWMAGPEIGTILEHSNWGPSQPDDGIDFGTQDILWYLAGHHNLPGKWDDGWNDTTAFLGKSAIGGYIIEYPGKQPDDPSLSGVVYHWKSHALLSSVEVSAADAASAQANPGDLFDLRALHHDAARGKLMVEIWANPTAPSGSFDFTVQAAEALGISFIPALSDSAWNQFASQISTTEIDFGAFSMVGDGVSGPVKLGTLSVDLLPGSTSVQVAFFDAQVDGAEVPGQTLSMLGHGVSDGQGAWAIEPLAEGTYALSASRAVGDGSSTSGISSADALAALRIAVGLSPNSDPDGPGPLERLPISPYQIMAADVNGSGTVTSADALAILRMAVRLPNAMPQEWMFVEETRDFWNEAANDGQGAFTLNRQNAQWDRDILAEAGSEVNLVGVLKGDVNGSWQPPAGSLDLDVVDPNHLPSLASLIGVPVEQWG